mmetsp:Transcript_11612/g.35055  ORF Transcript_11612/g.35055 Transcript_11612/m.35055 type:complete len:104 (-) Transcript_11612:1356-1667(-)
MSRRGVEQSSLLSFMALLIKDFRFCSACRVQWSNTAVLSQRFLSRVLWDRHRCCMERVLFAGDHRQSRMVLNEAVDAVSLPLWRGPRVKVGADEDVPMGGSSA